MKVWQKRGVAMRKATGVPASNAERRLTSWNGHGGFRVHTSSTPWGSAVVGVSTGIIFWPGPTTDVVAGMSMCVSSEVPLMFATIVYVPAFGGVNSTGQ